MKVSILSVKKQVSNESSVSSVSDKATKISKVIAKNAREQAEDAEIEEQVKELVKKSGVSVKSEKPKKATKVTVAKTSNTSSIKTKAKPAVKAQPKKAEAINVVAVPEAEPTSKLNLTMIQYTPKCIALFGDTKPIKEEIKSLRGRFNPSLHPLGTTDSIPGWVFPNKAAAEVQNLIDKYK